jgi:hypothetical protein
MEKHRPQTRAVASINQTCDLGQLCAIGFQHERIADALFGNSLLWVVTNQLPPGFSTRQDRSNVSPPALSNTTSGHKRHLQSVLSGNQ